MMLFRSAILLVALLTGGVAFADQNSNMAGFYGASHLTTELVLKTTKKISRDYRVTPYNRFFSSTLVLFVGFQVQNGLDSTPKEKTANLTALGFGIITGNLFQMEW